MHKTLVIFVFADLTLDGFHFWMTLSPRTSEPVRHAPVPAWSKILATPLLSLTVNVVTFSRPTAIYVLWCRPYQHFWDEPTSIHRAKRSAWCSVTQCVHCQHVTSTDFRRSTAPPPQKLGEQPLTLLPLFRRILMHRPNELLTWRHWTDRQTDGRTRGHDHPLYCASIETRGKSWQATTKFWPHSTEQRKTSRCSASYVSCQRDTARAFTTERNLLLCAVLLGIRRPRLSIDISCRHRAQQQARHSSVRIMGRTER